MTANMTNFEKQVWGIILAAGFSRRMGEPKMMLPYKGKPLIQHAIEECLKSQLDGIMVVVNPQINNLAEAVNMEGIDRILLNHQSHEGMSTSVKMGVQSLPETAQAAVFLLGDQPSMSSAEINRIIEDYHNHPDFSIIQARYLDNPGHPVLFKKHMFHQLLDISGDEGGKSVIKKCKQQVFYSNMNRKAIPDIDTPDEYRMLVDGELN